MKFWMFTVACCLVLSSAVAMAQQNYDFLKRDNPFGSAEQPQQQPVGVFGFCWMTGPVPNTKNIEITNVFQTQQSPSTLELELAGYERGLGINASFECTVDMYQVQQSHFTQKISSLAQQGYSIGQIQVRPH